MKQQTPNRVCLLNPGASFNSFSFKEHNTMNAAKALEQAPTAMAAAFNKLGNLNPGTLTGNAGDEKPEMSLQTKEAKSRKRMTTSSATLDEPRPVRQQGPAQSAPSVKLTQGGSTIEFTHGSQQEREKLLQFAEHQQKVNTATSWVSVFGQVAGAILAVVGSIAMTWAIVQGVRANSRTE